MKAVIIDDEVRGALSLQKMLRHIAPDLDVAALAHDGAEGIEAIATHKPSLVFLDIQMPDMTGFDMLHRLPEINFSVIFITAYDEFALKAFRHAAVDYLLKPVDIDELSAALKKLSQLAPQADPPPKNKPVEALLQHLQLPEQQKLALPSSEGLLFIPIQEVICVEAASNYSFFHTEKNGKVVVSRTMGEYEEVLVNNNFLRVHNSFLINLHKVTKYIKGEGGTVVMNNKMHIEVSRRRKEEFMKRLEEMNWKL